MSSAIKPDTSKLAVATAVRCTKHELVVTLSNGRTASAPLARYPRLWSATASQRANASIEAFGTSIHWPEIDEDIGVNQLLGVSEEELARFAGFKIFRRTPEQDPNRQHCQRHLPIPASLLTGRDR